MTKTFYSKTIRSLMILLAAICLFCTCAFAVACGTAEESETDTEKTYSYSETDTEIISNAYFAYGTHDKTADDMPIVSPTGWTKSVDDSAVSSNVDSGVVSVSADSWNKVFDKLYEDSDFLKVYENKYAADLDGKTDDEKKEFVKDKFKNPDKHEGADDGFVYMLNNYSAKQGKGTAQRLRSSSTVSVKKGETYTVSVWVYTNILNGDGANIRLANSVNGNSQADFRIDNILNNGEWKKYTVYFVANDDYDCTFTLTLGLGYGNGGLMHEYVEGTVFFDDVTVEKFEGDIAAVVFDGTETLFFGSSDVVSVLPAGNNVYKYDMNFKTDAGYTPDPSANTGAFFTNLPALPQVDLDHETKTVDIKNGTDNFEITTLAADEDEYERYTLISFKLQNNLNKLGSTDVTLNVVDILGAESNTRKAVATFSEVSENGEYTLCNVIVRNNFKVTGVNHTREFYLQLVIGPTDESAVTAKSEYATGSVVISDLKYATGYVNENRYKNDDYVTAYYRGVSGNNAYDPTDEEKDAYYLKYKLYSFYNSDADATTALYTGYDSDYSEHNHTPTYSLTPAKANIGEITAHPTAVNGYSGIVYNHVYVQGESADTVRETKINGRTSFDGADGYAGLINTEYLAAYTANLGNTSLEELLNGYYDAAADKHIQPIVIFNNSAENAKNHYGFIGAQQTVSESSYAKITVKLFVSGDSPKAYIYLVDTSKSEKDVLQFADFTVNTADGLDNAAINGTSYSAADHKFAVTVDKDIQTANLGDDNWVEINFYIATGADAKSFRVEVWNGGRDGADASASKGYVVVNSIDVTTSSAFTEPTSLANAFTDSSNPLFKNFDTDGRGFIAYTRELTDTEKAFNKEYPDQAVSYKATYVWAQNDTTVYAVFNTINPVEHNPYDDITEEETESGCNMNSDPSTFWLSFSTILLAVVLVAAIVALFIKRFAARHRSRKSESKSQYKVKSRTETQKEIKKAKEKQAQAEKKARETEQSDDEDLDIGDLSDEPESQTETAESAESAGETDENNGDDTEQSGYVYGDVQDFGDMTLEIPEDNKTENAENSDDKKDE